MKSRKSRRSRGSDARANWDLPHRAGATNMSREHQLTSHAHLCPNGSHKTLHTLIESNIDRIDTMRRHAACFPCPSIRPTITANIRILDLFTMRLESRSRAALITARCHLPNPSSAASQGWQTGQQDAGWLNGECQGSAGRNEHANSVFRQY